MSVALAQKTRVVVRPEAGAYPEEELCLLGALERFAFHHPRVQLEYATENAEVRALLKGRWFLADHWQIGSERFWEEHVLRGDLGVTLPEPDPLEAARAEEQQYQEWHAAETAKIQQQQAGVARMGIKDLVLPLPDYLFQPRWTKLHGYLWQLGDFLGLPVPVGDDPIDPYGQVPQRHLKEYGRLFRRARMVDRPFLVYDFRAEEQEMALVAAMLQGAGRVACFSLKEVERAADLTPAALLSLLAHPNAHYAVGPVGLLSTCAWAAGVPSMLELYSGANPGWDGTGAPATARIERDRTEAAQLPAFVGRGVAAMIARQQEEREPRTQAVAP